MRVASITEARNRLSALLDLVRAGETVTIVDRGRPVAKLTPAAGTDAGDDEARISRLERAGLVRRGTGKPPLDLILQQGPRPRASVVEAVLEERREGR